LLGVHRNTVYADLHAFHHYGLAALPSPTRETQSCRGRTAYASCVS
jgi:hypothetical protein